MFHMVEYVTSINEGGFKVVLWRKSDYMYQIEITRAGSTSAMNFEAEYYDAIDRFTEVVGSLGTVQN